MESRPAYIAERSDTNCHNRQGHLCVCVYVCVCVFEWLGRSWRLYRERNLSMFVPADVLGVGKCMLLHAFCAHTYMQTKHMHAWGRCVQQRAQQLF